MAEALAKSHRSPKRIQVCLSLDPQVRLFLIALAALHPYGEQSRVIASLLLTEAARMNLPGAREMLATSRVALDASVAAMNMQLRQYGYSERSAGDWQA